MSMITRRGALKGTAAVAAVAATPAVASVAAGTDHDAQLLDLCAEWHRLRDISEPLWKQAHEALQRANNDPDAPPMPGETFRRLEMEGQTYDRAAIFGDWDRKSKALYKRHGYTDLYNRADPVGGQAREVAEQLFGTPAHTHQGVLAKVRVRVRAEAQEEDPEVYPPYDEFAAIVLADLERLAGRAAS